MLLQGQRHSLCILGFQDQYLGQSKAIGHDHRIEEDTTEFNCLVTYPFSGPRNFWNLWNFLNNRAC